MGSRQERTEESHIVQQTLDDPQLLTALQAFSRLADKSMGPHGGIQALHNNVGGPLTMTSSASRLFSTLSFSRPCLRLIVSAAQGHLKTHHDGGLLVTALCLHLIQRAVKVESVGRRCVREVYDAFLQLTDVYLNDKNCPVCVNVDTSNLKLMLSYVRNIITTKPVCRLRGKSADHLSQLVLKAFLTSVPDSPRPSISDQIFVLQFDKADVLSSELVEGLLLEWPEKCVHLGQQSVNILRGMYGEVKVAVVNVSMSGDAEEILTNQVEAGHHVIQSVADLVIKKMIDFCDWLVEQKVGLLLCQKVIHPKVKASLRQRGVMFVERLGVQCMGYVQDLTGASLISSVLVTPTNDVCGKLNDVAHRILHGKSYLHLHRADASVCSLLLCSPVDEQLAELRCVVQSAVKGLWSTFQRPYMLCGGGCWQLHLATYVRHLAEKKSGELCSQLSITKAQLQQSVNALASSLETTALSLLDPACQAWTDTDMWHVWHSPHGVDLATTNAPFSCACGLVTNKDIDTNNLHPLLRSGTANFLGGGVEGVDKKPSGENAEKKRVKIREGVNYDWLVLDTKECVVSAVRTAVLTASTILSISQFIHDVN